MTSGQLELCGVLDQWPDVKSFLFADEAPKSEPGEQDDWNNMDWGWGEDDVVRSNKDQKQEDKEKEIFKKKLDAWVQNCVIASSPMGNVIVIANGSKAVFFMSEWDTENSRMRFLKSYEGDVAQEEGEKVSCALCIPLVSKKKTSPGAPDWTCILLGFTSGNVRMYTDNGNNLVNQLFHNLPVMAFKCRSYQPAMSSADHDQLEELFILYKSVIVTMDGFSLFQTLRACRNHLARLQANVADSMMDPPPLSYKKWQYENGEPVNDCEGIGLQTPGTFEHLYTGSLLGGFHAKLAPVPLTSYVFVSVGKKHYTAFHCAQEGQAVPVLTEIAYAMASKLKSSLISAASGWLGFGGASSAPAPKAPKEKPKIEPAAPMACRFGLVDHRRVGQCIVISPCRKLSAITDSLGRVVLIDNNIGIAVRMWKGYRDAQVGWLQVDEEVHSRSKTPARKALFLVIYAPKRSTLEVYAMQQGPKVATFNVSTKSGRLLTTTFGMMGLNNIPIRGGNRPVSQCVFIDADAKLFSINIPFHLALCDKTSSKVKDMHLLKTLQKLLKERENGPTTDEIMALLKEVHTQSMINQAFKILTHKSKNTEVLKEVFDKYIELFCDQEEKDLSVVFRLQSLLDLYMFLMESANKPPEYTSTMAVEGTSEESSNMTLLQCLHSTEKEMKVLQEMASKKLEAGTKRIKLVKFEDDSKFTSLHDYYSSLCIEFDTTKAKAQGDARHVKLNHKNEFTSTLGSLLFCGVLNNKSLLNEWKTRLRNSSLVPTELMLLAFKFWCENAILNSSYVVTMEQLYHVLTAICELEDPSNVTSEFSRVSRWWEEVRKEITKSPQIFHIYSFSIVCRGVAIDVQNQAEKNARESGKKELMNNDQAATNPDDPSASSSSEQPGTAAAAQEENEKQKEESIMSTSLGDSEEWETISLDLLKWNLLLKQIEDLYLLSIVLVQKPHLSSPALPLLSNDIEELSVLNLLDKGKGCIAELVGKWLTTIGIDPMLVVEEDADSPGESSQQRKQSPPEAPPSPEPKGRRKKKQVPPEEGTPVPPVTTPPATVDQDTCVESGAEALVEVNKGIPYIQELIRFLKENFSVSLSSSIILANYCWEYCLEWNKETNEVIFLEAAVKCVNAIPEHYIKQGIMSMMWSTFIAKSFSSIVSASGSGTASKDKLFDGGKYSSGPVSSGFLSLDNQETFLKLCVEFLDVFMEVNVVCEGLTQAHASSSKTLVDKQKPSLSARNHWSSDDHTSTASLTDLALLQPTTNYEMILIHYQLALVTHFLHKFRIKKASLKPSNLFDTKCRMMFFQALSGQAPYTNIDVDLGLKMLREEFLCLVISNAVHEIPEELSEDSGPNDDAEYRAIVPSLDGVKECEHWVQNCFDLGRIWGLDLDCLRINEVCEFYSSGLDLLGLEVISSVSAKDVLGAKLLVIAGMRINFIIDNNRDNVTEIVSSISTNLSNWLKSLNYSKLRCLRFTKQSISELAQQLLQLIPESSYDYKLAEELLLSSNFL